MLARANEESEIHSRKGKDLPPPTQPPIQWVLGVLFPVKVQLITQIRLVSKLRKPESTTPLLMRLHDMMLN